MRATLALLIACLSLLPAYGADAAVSYLSYKTLPNDEPANVVNRPADVQGLTGLIFTNSAYTQPKGRIVAGLAAIAENSATPDFSVAEGIATVTVGVTDTIEFGVKASMFGTNFGSSKTREIGAGDTDLLVKWRISSQGDSMPALALGLGYTLPTGNESKGFRGVTHEGTRLMVIGTSEKEMPGGDYFIGIYFEGQIVYNDKLPGGEDKPYTDKYGAFNAGLLFPLREDRRLQALLEYTSVVKKDIPTVYAENHGALMPGLRYVTEDLNASAGVQFYHPDAEEKSNELRYIVSVSYAF